MSVDIEFRHAALRLSTQAVQAMKADFPNVRWDYCYDFNEPNYFVFVEAGSNNTIDMDNKISRHWHLFACGTKYNCMHRIIAAARDVHSGCVRFRNGATLPENYIRHYRHLIDNAVDLAAIRRPGILTIRLADTWEQPVASDAYGHDALRRGGHPMTATPVIQSLVERSGPPGVPGTAKMRIPINATDDSARLLWWLLMSQGDDRGAAAAHITLDSSTSVLDGLADLMKSSRKIA